MLLLIYCLIFLTILGDGKTYYIKNQLSQCENFITIAINEAFTPSKAISKLRSLPLYQNKVGIFFNFTILPPGVSTLLRPLHVSDTLENIANPILL